MKQDIIKVIKYFSYFQYCPTFKDIHTFISKKVSKKALNNQLLDLERHNRLISNKNYKMKNEKYVKYTIPEYSILSQKLNLKVKNKSIATEQFNNYLKKQQISKDKLNAFRFKAYIKLLSLFPQIKLVGLSGSISMMNATLEDDIDLFIITDKNRLFTGRILATVLAIIMGLKRRIGQHKAPNKVCLNLFFDEKNMIIPKKKQSIYVGHEVLQMKPLVNKNNIYERFLNKNQWVFKLFPNAMSVFSIKYRVSSIRKKIPNTKYYILNTVFNNIEFILKSLQLALINKHKTTEIITDSQLWFHPEDYNSYKWL